MKITDVVFTDHAIKRINERGISGQWAWDSIKKADTVNPGKEKHTTEFVKKIGEKTLTTIAKKNDIGEWVVLSVWIDPPFEGTKDFAKKQSYLRGLERNHAYDKRMDRASFWGKLWLTFRKQLGL